MQTQDLIDLMNDRALAYRFLARLYRCAPDTDLVNVMREESKSEVAGHNFLASFFTEVSHLDNEQIRIDLAADYNRLFLGMSAHPVAPFESVYTSTEGLLMQEAYEQVLDIFQSEGVTASEDFNLPEDHLSLELNFMAHLARRTHVALLEGDNSEARRLIFVQQSFLDDHLTCWVSSFCAEVISCAQTGFFKQVAAMTDEQVKTDKALLSEVEIPA